MNLRFQACWMLVTVLAAPYVYGASSDTTATPSAKDAIDIEKARVDLEQARIDLYKSIIPDPSKLATAASEAPKLNAAADRLLLNDVRGLASTIASQIVGLVSKPNTGTCSNVVIVNDPAALQLYLTSFDATSNSLEWLSKSLDAKTSRLDDLVSPPSGPARNIAPAVGVIAEFALSLVKIAKPVYAFGAADRQTTADALLLAAVKQQLLSQPNGCVTFIEPAAAVLLPTKGSAAGVGPGTTPGLIKLIDGLRQSIANARQEIKKADAFSKAVRDNKKAPQSLVGRADAVDELKKSLLSDADLAEAGLSQLFVVSAAGTTPLDLARRGEVLSSVLAGKALFILAVKATASDFDTVVRDGLFTRFRVLLGSTTLAQWQLSDGDGVVRAVQVLKSESKLDEVCIDRAANCP